MPDPEPPGPKRPAPSAVTFWEFFRDLFVPAQGLELPCKDAHKEACDVMQAALIGEIDKQFIVMNVPFRTGKTKMAQALGAYTWGHFPDAQAIYTSYAGPLAEESLAYITRVLQAAWFVEVYGDILHTAKADHATTTSGGNFYAEGVGGELLGKGAGLKRPAGGFIVVDDPTKPQQALSPVVGETNRNWFDLTLRTRRNSERWTPIFIIQQRLAVDDLSGHVLKTYPDLCYHLKKPGIVNGVSQFPETFTAEGCETLKRTRIGRFVYNAQIQQNPSSLGGNLIPVDRFGRYDVREARALHWERIVVPIDTALKAKEANDFSAGQAWGRLDGRAYLLDAIHGKWETPELITNVGTFYRKLLADFPRTPIELVIEEKTAGPALMAALQRLGIPSTGIERDVDKVRRVQAILNFIESGLALVPQDGSVPWLEDMLDEFSQFTALMNHAHDDRVDVMADAIRLLLGEGPSILDVLGPGPLPSLLNPI